MLLAGPSGAGKTMLVHAICTELGATLFDLTATNIVGKYPGKSGLNMLLHLVIKVSKLLQPAIIYIDRAEKTFLKKVSKTDKSDPKRLKKDLPRLVRSLTSEDRVMLIGVSRSPWECEQKVILQSKASLIHSRNINLTIYRVWRKHTKNSSSYRSQITASDAHCGRRWLLLRAAWSPSGQTGLTSLGFPKSPMGTPRVQFATL